MIDKLRSLKDKFELLEEQLSDPEVTSDMKRFLKRPIHNPITTKLLAGKINRKNITMLLEK